MVRSRMQDKKERIKKTTQEAEKCKIKDNEYTEKRSEYKEMVKKKKEK